MNRVVIVQILLVVLQLDHFAVLAEGEDDPKAQLRIEDVTIEPTIIHLQARNGPACGTATLRVAVTGSSDTLAPNLKVRSSLTEYSSDPPGVRVDITNVDPASGVATLTRSPSTFTFRFCAVGNYTGKVVVQGNIMNLESTGYKTEENPISSRREVTVNQ